MEIEPFLLRSLLAGCGLAILCGMLGPFVVWNKMAYFGSALSHSALLGVASAIWLNIDPKIGIIIIAIIFSILMVYFQTKQTLADDTLLGILSHSSLALGVIVITFHDSPFINLQGFLFGEILTVTRTDLIILLFTSLVTALFMRFHWSDLLMITIDEDLAQVEGINVRRTRFLLFMIISLTIAIAIQIVGILLLVSMLIIPAACVNRFSNTPLQAVILSCIVGLLSCLGGIALSWFYDTPTGPSIVLVASLAFLLTTITKKK